MKQIKVYAYICGAFGAAFGALGHDPTALIAGMFILMGMSELKK